MKTILPLSLFLTIALSACGPSAGPKGGVALVDLDAVAKRLGRDTAIVDELKSAGAPLGDQLVSAQKDYQAQINSFKDSLGAKPTEADNQKLAELARKLNVELQQKQQAAQQELGAKRAALVSKFREEVRPVAMKIASGKGLGIVLVKSDMVVLGSEPGLDITDDVVGEMVQAGGGTPAPASSAKP